MSSHVAVAGAGIIGSSIAWRLAQAGHRVTLFDAGAMGAEASHAGAGMLAPGAEVEDLSEWSEQALEGSRLYPGFVRELTEATGESIDYRREGAVEVANDAAEWAELERRTARQSALGIVSEECDPLRTVPGVSAPHGARARFYPADATVDPRDVMRALKLATAHSRIRLCEHTPVRRIDCLPGAGSEITLSDGATLHCDTVVIAAGAWSGAIVVDRDAQPVRTPESFPVRGHLLGYSHLPPRTLGPILRRGHTYLLQRSGGFFLAGASAERVGFRREVDPAEVAAVRARAEALFTPLRGAPAEPWVGFRPATHRLSPELGFLAGTRVYLAYGHYRNGILMAPATARRAVAAITAS